MSWRYSWSAWPRSSCDWTGRTRERRRAEIREFFGFTESSVADQADATDWLVAEVTEVERRAEEVGAVLLSWLSGWRLEPPTAGRIERIVRSALARGEARLIETGHRVAAGGRFLWVRHESGFSHNVGHRTPLLSLERDPVLRADPLLGDLGPAIFDLAPAKGRL
ncbi:DUF4158 domain-containing protein [Amycolatopsis sp. lyj-108]|uniref:DUF4158 domain-containing protein n=1 Tax=Amycolatopsis sp. lyj-108 TaxID=2789286 RepID=UPI0039789C21